MVMVKVGAGDPTHVLVIGGGPALFQKRPLLCDGLSLESGC